MKHFTVCQGPYGDTGLLFSDVTAANSVPDSPELHALFPDGFFAVPVSSAQPSRWGYRSHGDDKLRHTLVCPGVEFPLPDEATIDTGPVVFYKQGEKVSVNLRERYNRCLSFFKAVGCTNCPEKGLTCISQGAGVNLANGNGSRRGDLEDLLNDLKKKKPSIGGYSFVHPSLTKRKSFASNERQWWAHAFEGVERNKQDLSDSAKRAAKTRRFKKDYCTGCPIKKGCDRARSCRGPFEAEELVIKKSVASLKEAFAKSKFKPWQLWELNRGAGKRAKHSRWEVVLQGVQYSKQDKALSPCVYRAKTSIVEYRKLETYEELAEVFDLAKEEKDAAPPPNDEKFLAIWWQTLHLSGHGRRGWAPRYVIGSSVTNHNVTVGWGQNRHLGWDTELHNFSDISSQIYYGQLPDAEQMTVR